MLGAEHLLSQYQRAFQERSRRCKVTLILKQDGEVVEARRRIGMLGESLYLYPWGLGGSRWSVIFRGWVCQMSDHSRRTGAAVEARYEFHLVAQGEISSSREFTIDDRVAGGRDRRRSFGRGAPRRIKVFCAVHECEGGTKRTCDAAITVSAFRGKADAARRPSDVA
jgi:hypothetical protein